MENLEQFQWLGLSFDGQKEEYVALISGSKVK
jgi:hypothetical protein